MQTCKILRHLPVKKSIRICDWTAVICIVNKQHTHCMWCQETFRVCTSLYAKNNSQALKFWRLLLDDRCSYCKNHNTPQLFAANVFNCLANNSERFTFCFISYENCVDGLSLFRTIELLTHAISQYLKC